MKKTVSKKSSANSNVINFLITELTYCAVFLLTFLIASGIIYFVDLKRSMVYPAAIFSFCLSAFISGVLCGLKQRKNGLLNALIYVTPINIIIVLISLVFNNFSFDANVLVSLLLMIISSIMGGIIGVNIKVKK